MDGLNIDNLKSEVKDDLCIDMDDLASESIRTPKLYGKYLNIHFDVSLVLDEMMVREKKLYKQLWEYYTGKAGDDVYVKHPLNITVIKSDANIYINANTSMIKLKGQISEIKTLALYLEKVLKQIENRGFQIKNAIDYQRFQSGY